LQTHVSSSGCLHIVADERHMLDAIDALDLQRARLLARLSAFWNQQAQCACSFQTTRLLSSPAFSSIKR